MATDLTMPKLDMSMTEGELSEWLVEDGAQVAAGQPIYAVEADKATQEVEAPVGGILKRVGQIGETYAVGAKIGEIG